MISKKKALKDCRLYLVLDASVAGYERLLHVAELAVDAGVDIIQLRDKGSPAKTVLEAGRKLKQLIGGRALLIINDRLDLALAIQADGIHLGQDDMPVQEARAILGKGYIIGASCQNIDHLLRAQADGADYVGFGSVYKTATKPQRLAMDLSLLEKALHTARIPLFAIGGINKKNIKALVDVGVQRVALTRALINTVNVGEETRAIKEFLLSDFMRV